MTYLFTHVIFSLPPPPPPDKYRHFAIRGSYLADTLTSCSFDESKQHKFFQVVNYILYSINKINVYKIYISMNK